MATSREDSPLLRKPPGESGSTDSLAASDVSEPHSKNGDHLHDFIVGFADGLTVPFALTAGLSSLGSTKIVIAAGLAELISGSVSMGLGAYLAALSDRQRYDSEHCREVREVLEEPETEREEIFDILCSYGATRDAVTPFVDSLCKNHTQWVKFMMDFELKLERPSKRNAYIAALVMGVAYFIGGLLPMIPYFIADKITTALYISIGVTAVILLIFGYSKSRFLGCSGRQSAGSAVNTLCVGAVAAGASYGIVRAINSNSPM